MNTDIKDFIIESLQNVADRSILSLQGLDNFEKLIKGAHDFRTTRKNIIMKGVSQNFISSINELVKDGFIVLSRCAFLTAYSDGFVYKDLNEVEYDASGIDKKHQEPRWQPMLIKRGQKYYQYK